MQKPFRTIFAALLLLLPGLFAAGCASLAHGTHQEVGVDSFPSGARVLINGQMMGVTPAVFDLKRNVTQKIQVEMAGYQPYETVLNRTMSGWVIATAAVCGIAGLAIDKFDGALYNLTPGRIEARLSKAKAAIMSKPVAVASPPVEEAPSNEIRRLGPPVSDGSLTPRLDLETRLNTFVSQLPASTGVAARRP